MPDLLTTLQTLSSAKNRAVAFENAPTNEGIRATNGSQDRESRLLVETSQGPSKRSLDSHANKSPSTGSSDGKNGSFRKGHKKVDSVAFLKQSYLTETIQQDLSDDAREILKSQPDREDLLAVLQYLQYGIGKKHDFNIRAPSAKSSQITNALVTVTLVDHWHHLKPKRLSQEDKQLKNCLISCLTSVTGLGALLSQIKKSSISTSIAGRGYALTQDMISALEHILAPQHTIYDLIQYISTIIDKPTQRHVVWQELVSLIAGSKILTVVAQSQTTRKFDEASGDWTSWLGDGSRYCAWLARNIAHAATKIFVQETEAWSMLGQITKRGFSLGNRDSFVSEIYSSLLLGHKASWTALHELLRSLPRWEQKAFFDGMMRDVSRRSMFDKTSSISLNSLPIVQDRSIEAVAALVAGITENNEFLQKYIVDWLVDDNGANASIGLPARRAVIATLSNHEAKLRKILDRCLEMLSDKVQIQHGSILQQEATAQTMLLAVACLYRHNPNSIKTVTRSSSYINVVSNRLGASIPRARYLGMVIGVALSRLVDEPSKAMDFGSEDMESDESKAWLDLVRVHDKIGSIEHLQDQDRSKRMPTKTTAPETHLKPATPKQKPPSTSKIISIEEVESSEPDDDEDEDDLLPHQKPDDDPSDSEEDPTLIDRSKPTAPVYILDLIKGLNENDKPDVVHLALKTAPSLIRRKTGFGTELSESIDRLASSLLNLSEGISKPSPQKHRLQALIACVIALPERMAPWLASMYFDGDFSLVQRATLLTTLGLSARELAGHTDDPALTPPQDAFPSKRLPEKFAAIYAPLDSITSSLSRATLQPMALSAADTLSGPNALKVRTFSSRLEVSRKSAQKSKDRSTRIPKHLHKILAESFYLPLCTRMSLLLSTRPQFQRSTLFEPHICKLFLQTLSILLNTLGPHAAQLHTLTRETLLLLTHFHNTPLAHDPAILPPTLQLLLSVLDLNIAAGGVAEERLVTDFGPTIAELMAWIAGLQERSIPTLEGQGMGMPWNVIAAGCQVKWQEVGRKFQGRMLGLTGGEFDGF